MLFMDIAPIGQFLSKLEDRLEMNAIAKVWHFWIFQINPNNGKAIEASINKKSRLKSITKTPRDDIFCVISQADKFELCFIL